MRRSVLAAALLALGALARPARAELPEDAAVRANNEIAAYGVLRHLGYNENNTSTPQIPTSYLDEESGWVPGFRVQASVERTVLKIPNLYLALGVTWLSGPVDYTGYSQQQVGGQIAYAPANHTSGATILDVDAAVGLGFGVLDHRGLVTPFFGYRHHHWTRTLAEDTTTPYSEDYDHNALGVGLLASMEVAPELVLGVDGFAGSTISPSLLVTAPTLTVGYNFDLGSKVDLELGARLDYAVVPHWHLLFEYRLVSFGYGPSTAVNITPQLSLAEPDSSTITHELRVGVAYGF
jgi:opacity protein-like surface antigen